MRASFAIAREGAWLTPLGEVAVAQDLADLILQGSELIRVDDQAHLNEHSLEVQLPFIQFFRKKVSLVPICVSYDADYEQLEELGLAVAKAIKGIQKDVLIVASTDMSHYVSQKEAERKDSLAIKKILELDARGLYETVQSEDISMCGFQPTAAAIVASKKLGAEKAELIKYQTSGETTGNYLEVVGYAGFRIR
jgi:AmmeMemoRadiSam system protein B